MHLVFSCSKRNSNNNAAYDLLTFLTNKLLTASVYFCSRETAKQRQSEHQNEERKMHRQWKKFILFDRIHCSKWYRMGCVERFFFYRICALLFCTDLRTVHVRWTATANQHIVFVIFFSFDCGTQRIKEQIQFYEIKYVTD